MKKLVAIDNLHLIDDHAKILSDAYPDGIACKSLTWKNIIVSLAKVAILVGIIAGPSGALNIAILASWAFLCLAILVLGCSLLMLVVLEDEGAKSMTTVLVKRPWHSRLESLLSIGWAGAMAWNGGGWVLAAATAVLLAEVIGTLGLWTLRLTIARVLVSVVEGATPVEEE